MEYDVTNDNGIFGSFPVIKSERKVRFGWTLLQMNDLIEYYHIDYRIVLQKPKIVKKGNLTFWLLFVPKFSKIPPKHPQSFLNPPKMLLFCLPRNFRCLETMIFYVCPLNMVQVNANRVVISCFHALSLLPMPWQEWSFLRNVCKLKYLPRTLLILIQNLRWWYKHVIGFRRSL